ncbi:MAG: hypothetical protein PHQ95_00785 [Candidatus Gracilibacteria bacterium]|nr:hypothetical protein [Candidatus Gracilibacteria bacterium]
MELQNPIQIRYEKERVVYSFEIDGRAHMSPRKILGHYKIEGGRFRMRIHVPAQMYTSLGDGLVSYAKEKSVFLPCHDFGGFFKKIEGSKAINERIDRSALLRNNSSVSLTMEKSKVFGCPQSSNDIFEKGWGFGIGFEKSDQKENLFPIHISLRYQIHLLIASSRRYGFENDGFLPDGFKTKPGTMAGISIRILRNRF